MDKTRLCIVIPCYNEQEVLPITAPMFREELQVLMDSCDISGDSRILFVDDGSRDDTWKIITDLAASDLGVGRSDGSDAGFRYHDFH